MDWYLEPWRKFADFSGRARRREYWTFALINFVVALVLGLVDRGLGLTFTYGMGILGLLFALVCLIPGLAVSVRRLHDTGRSGWWILIALIPFLGALVLLVLVLLDSEPQTNQYGPSPKYAGVVPAT